MPRVPEATDGIQSMFKLKPCIAFNYNTVAIFIIKYGQQITTAATINAVMMMMMMMMMITMTTQINEMSKF